MYLIVGLGNPGEQYSRTRHNIGFAVVDAIAEDLGTPIRRREFSALTATARIGRSEVLIIKPQTYMNLSGRSVCAALTATAASVEDVIVVHDEVDLPLGRLRVKSGGGSGGHRGIDSIAEECGSREFARVRFGVGRPPGEKSTAEYVLEPFTPRERDEFVRQTRRAADAVCSVITQGIGYAMSAFNAAPDAGDGPIS